MAKIEVIVLSAAVEARIKQMLAAGVDMTSAWASVGHNIVRRIRLCFRLSKSPVGAPWEPLKIRQGQPLVDTGRLRRSITFKADPQGVTIGTNLKYAPIHQFGGTISAKNAPFLVFKTPTGFARKKKVIPARPFMPLSPTGTLDMPPTWAASVINVLASRFNLTGRDQRYGAKAAT